MSTSTPSAAPARDRKPRQLGALISATHPRQAIAIAVVVGLLVGLTRDDPAREIGLAGAAVLLTQLISGLLNDLLDVDLDKASGAEDKPIATGALVAGNASFAVAVLLLLAIPVSLQNGTTAGVCLLATVLVAYVHNRWLHRTALSFLGWAVTFALLTYFIALGGVGQDASGSDPYLWFTLLCAALGVCVHFLTSLPDLVRDNAARVRHLPLRVALHTGATKLLIFSGVLTLLVVGTLVAQILSAGSIRQ